MWEKKRLVFDGIVYALQRSGGISTYFTALVSRAHKLKKLEASLLMYSHADERTLSCQIPRIGLSARKLERYRGVVLDKGVNLLHSSYYRVPEKAEKGLQVITTVHDFTYERFVSGVRKQVHKWQKNQAIRRSSLIICVSEQTKQDLLRFVRGIDEKKVHVIHNGVSNDFFVDNSVHRFRPQRPYALYVGARGGYKRFHLAVEAVHLVKDLALYVVGGGDLSKQEQGMLEKYLPKRYQFLGHQSVSELNTLYNNAFALIYPSAYEGFGIPLLEAMRAGCPIVAQAVSSLPEVGGEAVCWVESPDAQGFARALEQLDSESLRLHMAAQGQQQSALYSWDRCFEQTEQLYESLL